MLIKPGKKITVRYKWEKLRRYVIRTGVLGMIGLLLLCVLEMNKEKIAVSYYEKILYCATEQGRWLKYGRYEPDNLYQKTLEKLPHFCFARQQGLQKAKEEKLPGTLSKFHLQKLRPPHENRTSCKFFLSS